MYVHFNASIVFFSNLYFFWCYSAKDVSIIVSISDDKNMQMDYVFFQSRKKQTKSVYL